jgi:anti-sigma-K factor RskA
MNNRDLDELLRSYANKPVPTPPSNLEDAVWREIRLRRQTTPVREPLLDWLAACVWRGHSLAVSVLAAAALGAAVAGFAQNASTARPISRALNLQVFSEQPPTLRLTNPYLQP